MVAAEEESVTVIIRQYEPEKDCQKVEEVERICEVGPSGKLSLFTDQLGDPVCRIRNSPTSLMLVSTLLNFLCFVMKHIHTQYIPLAELEYSWC